MRHQFGRREYIPLHESILWRIETGVVRTLTWDQEQVQTTLGLWGAGDLVGEPISVIAPYRMQCLTEVEVSVLPTSLWHSLIDNLLVHSQQAENLLRILHYTPNQVRLYHFLVWLGQRFGDRIPQGYLIDWKITHQEIAELVGLSRVSVTRLLNQFRREGMIDWSSDRFLIIAAQDT
ncbi:MAG: Crp/Fnr family transcriptional regulator [Pseudanabaenaceae cyanobacterium bins.68]|nr:Crp/Fnr family transcriptional regulator [Pseudanabaenaceae cyanobacterium bins.68]